MNTGLPRQLALMAWPGWIAETSTSIEASASTSADGFIWLTSGITAVAAPTPAKETAAMLMKSRRRTPVSACVSAVDCSVVAIPIPCVTRCSGKPRATRNTGLPPGVAPPDSRERHKMPTAYFCFLLHGRPRPMRYGHAHRLAGAGYCGKSVHDPAAFRLSWRGHGRDRAVRFSLFRQEVEACRHGLRGAGGGPAPRRLGGVQQGEARPAGAAADQRSDALASRTIAAGRHSPVGHEKRRKAGSSEYNARSQG